MKENIMKNYNSSLNMNELNLEIIKISLEKITQNYGIGILGELKRINALLKDFMPKNKNERKILIKIFKDNNFQKINFFSDFNQLKNKNFLLNITKEITEEFYANFDEVTNIIKIVFDIINIYKIEIKGKELTKEDINNFQENTKILNKFNIIGYKAFSSNLLLKEIEIPANILEIRERAFFNCVNLNKVLISEKIESIGKLVFEGCVSIEKIFVNSDKYKIINEMLVDISEKKLLRSFSKLKECNIPNDVEIILEKSFEYSKLEKIYISKIVKKIEKRTFYCTNFFEEYVVSKENEYYSSVEGVLYTKNKEKLIHYPQNKKEINYIMEDEVIDIEDMAFSYSKNLKNLTFSNLVEKIGKKSFEHCEKIENIILPRNIKIIEEKAFQFLTNLKFLILSFNLEEIGDLAFYNCINLKSVIIPNKVKKIGDKAFAKCKSLKKVIIQENVEFIGEGVFSECENLELYIKNNLYVENYCRRKRINFIRM